MEINRINRLFKVKQQNVLSVYFTAGFPKRDDTKTIIETLAQAGVDMIEIGIPFSDPLADGPVIQQSSQIALQNGISLKLIFEQLKNIRESVDIPLLLMGYLNPVLQFGIERFLDTASQAGIDGIILPDLPLDEYRKKYHSLFKKYNVHNIFLITPQTAEKRIREIDSISDAFIYMVSSASTTGAKKSIEQAQVDYFERINGMNLKNPRLIGFGISSRQTFAKACKYAQGAIIGSAFIRAVSQEGGLEDNIRSFVSKIR